VNLASQVHEKTTLVASQNSGSMIRRRQWHSACYDVCNSDRRLCHSGTQTQGAYVDRFRTQREHGRVNHTRFARSRVRGTATRMDEPRFFRHTVVGHQRAATKRSGLPALFTPNRLSFTNQSSPRTIPRSPRTARADWGSWKPRSRCIATFCSASSMLRPRRPKVIWTPGSSIAMGPKNCAPSRDRLITYSI
jgi:hypothetical protein